ncbi:uncharacterized protein [Embiotoca jacksoni]|uniref:uncharacterized protein n=1 Tax=Embiotoca jacksoni TaxID=100190 RepID=UPI003704CB83
MIDIWILLFLLLSGGMAFMIHNNQHSLCLENPAGTAEVLLKQCNLDSASQQWMWINQGMLMCVASSRCLWAQHREPVRTQSCYGPQIDDVGLMWECDRDRLISRNTSMLLSVNGQHLVLSQHSKQSKWRSLDEGDICQERLRLRRASGSDPAAEEQTGELAAMTEEQREYLRWFYRTEDPTTWKFVLLGLAFICLLIGFLLLGMGSMANKSRKKIAQYKAAAALVHRSEDEELRVISALSDLNGFITETSSPSDRLQGDRDELRAGNIVVTWKNGNTSCLYSDPAEEEEKQEEEEEEKQEEEEEEKREEVSTAQVETQDGVTITE